MSKVFIITGWYRKNAHQRLRSVGLITFHKACAVLQKFKTDYIANKRSTVHRGNLNKRKRKTLVREDEILLLVREFDHLEGTFPFELNSDAVCVDFARRIGPVGKEPECGRTFVSL